ncbi:hypothetical protein [Flagellimonas sp.]|uniref:hypothetical protein n=1 Tax=Flagellimonas sp. TaxID=2058762 RepID=UPI003BB1A9C4
MKALQISSYILVLVFSLGSISGCSNDDNGPEPGCYQDDNRSIVNTVKNISGTIMEEESCGFVIKPDEALDKNPLGTLRPCNLDGTFQVDGTKVIFSGYIYESFETEDICADFFELIDIEISNP